MPCYRRNWVYIGVREFEFYAIQSNSNGKTHTVGDINVTGFAYYERIFGQYMSTPEDINVRVT